MCKKLIILCAALVVVGLSVPASAAYIGFDEYGNVGNALRVDIDGDGASPKAGWQTWSFARSWTAPQAAPGPGGTFANPLAEYSWELPTAELDIYRKGNEPTNGGAGARNRNGGMAFVPGTGEFSATGKGFGMNYIKLTLDHLQANTNYRIYLWSMENRGVWSNDPCNPNSKYVVWSCTNPKEWLDTHGYSGDNGEPNGYGPINQPQPPDPLTALSDSNMPAGLAELVRNCGKRSSLIVEDGNDHLGEMIGRTSLCCCMSNDDGVIVLYGWMDATTWGGSMHVPLNGFMVVPEPATVALLGLGGLALIRRRKHA